MSSMKLACNLPDPRSCTLAEAAAFFYGRDQTGAPVATPKPPPSEKEIKEKLDLLATSPSAPPPQPPRPQLVMRRMMQVRTGGMRSQGKSQIYSTNLVYSDVKTSAAATTLLVSLTVSPMNSGEWASFKSLYDEYRCTHINLLYTIAFSGPNLNVARGVIAFDPTDNTALSTLADGMTYKTHQLTVSNNSAGAGLQGFPQAVSPKGYWELSAKVPLGPARSTVTTAISGDQWMSTQDALDIPGYFKVIYEAASAGVTTSLLHFVQMRCEFRNRQ